MSEEADALSDQASDLEAEYYEKNYARPNVEKRKPIMFQSASSGLWYYNYQAAGDVSAVKLNGHIYIKEKR